MNKVWWSINGGLTAAVILASCGWIGLETEDIDPWTVVETHCAQLPTPDRERCFLAVGLAHQLCQDKVSQVSCVEATDRPLCIAVDSLLAKLCTQPEVM